MDISITLHKQNIVNDVSAECNLLGRTMEATSTDNEAGNALRELAGYIKSPDDNETRPVVARAMTEGWSQVKECCQRYLKFGRDIDDNRLESITTAHTAGITILASSFFDDSEWAQTQREIWEFATQKGTKYTLVMDFTAAAPTGGTGTYALVCGSDTIWTGTFDTNPGKITASWYASETNDGAMLKMTRTSGATLPTPGTPTAQIPMDISWALFDDYYLDLKMDESFNVGVTSSITSYAHRLIVDTVIAAVLKNQRVDSYTQYLGTAKVAKDGLCRVLQARSSFTRHSHDWM